MAEAWPLIGRGRQLNAGIRAVTGKRGVVFAGTAGVGKTRLTRELLAERRERGWLTDWVAATPAARSIPFGAFAPLLPVLRTKRRTPARDSIDVLLLARRAILDRSAASPYLLAIDDAHLLDEASALLAFQLASAADRIALVLTVRDDELLPEPVTALWKEGLCERVYLQPLSRVKVSKLLQAVLGGPVDGLLTQQAWKASAGNMLYLQELIEAARGKGKLAQVGGVWRTTSQLAMGHRLLDLIQTHLAGVPPRTRRVLEIVAVGEPIDIEALDRVAEPADVEDGERRGLLTWESEATPPVIRLAHPLYAEALRRRMTPKRRSSIIHELAEVFGEKGSDQGGELLRYVSWRLESSEHVPAATLLQAARRALEAMDLDLAERLAAASLEAGGQTRARIFLAGVHYRQGRGDEALEDLDRIHPRDERQRTETQILRVLVLFNALGRARDAEHALDAAIDQARDPDCHAWLLAMRANMLHFAGYPAEAVAIAGPLVDRADLSPRPLLAALSALGPGLALSGRGEEAVRVAERGMDPTLRAVDEVGGSINWAVGTAFLAHLVCGNLDDAGAVAVLQFETALGLRSREAHGAGATSVGWVALLRGRIATAVRFFREAEPHLRRADLFGLWPACLGGLAQGLALMGDLRGADEVLRQAEVSGRPGVRWLEFCVDRGRAWTCSIRDRSAAAGLCLKAGDIAHDRGQLPFAVLAYHDAARIGAPEQALPALREAAGHTDGPFPPAAVSHAAALATSDRAGLLEAADTFEGLGMLLIAAEAVVEAQQLGARQQDRRLAARAATLVAKCEGSITPTLADKVKRPSRLTQRELTVARLASQGHSSKAIARQLAVSVRTVDSHLARAYQKLGVVSRQELSSVLSTSGRAGSTTRRV